MEFITKKGFLIFFVTIIWVTQGVITVYAQSTINMQNFSTYNYEFISKDLKKDAIKWSDIKHDKSILKNINFGSTIFNTSSLFKGAPEIIIPPKSSFKNINASKNIIYEKRDQIAQDFCPACNNGPKPSGNLGSILVSKKSLANKKIVILPEKDMKCDVTPKDSLLIAEIEKAIIDLYDLLGFNDSKENIKEQLISIECENYKLGFLKVKFQHARDSVSELLAEAKKEKEDK